MRVPDELLVPRNVATDGFATGEPSATHLIRVGPEQNTLLLACLDFPSLRWLVIGPVKSTPCYEEYGWGWAAKARISVSESGQGGG